MKSHSCLWVVPALFALGCDAKVAVNPVAPPQRVVAPEGSQVTISKEPAVVAAETPAETAVETPSTTAADSKPESKAGWVSLFDGKSLSGWKSTEFGGEGEVKVEDEAIVMEMGQDMTGITWDGKEPPPKNNYEIRLEAARVDGGDFFCGLTFPVDESHASFIVGGWGGGVVGISSIDGLDASENETTKYMDFKTGQWYKIRVRVTKDRLQTWIDDKEVVDQDITGRKLGIRSEVDLSKPLGFSTWNTKGALRNIQLRKLDAETEPKPE